MTGILLIPLLASLLNSTFSFCIDTKYHIFCSIQSYLSFFLSLLVDSSSSLILGYTSAQTLLLFSLSHALSYPWISSSAMTLNIMDINLHVLSCVQSCNPMDCHLLVTPLSMGFSSQEHWSGFPFLSSRIFLT